MDPELASAVAEKELSKPNFVQLAIHFIPHDLLPDGLVGRNDVDPNTVIVETPYRTIPSIGNINTRQLWRSKQLVLFEGRSDSSPKTSRVEVPTYIHYLTSIHMLINTPHLCVKDEYQDIVKIRWTHNLSGNVGDSSTFLYGKTYVDQLNSFVDDVERQFNEGGSGRSPEIRSIYQGIHPLMTKWSTSIAPSEVYFFPPYYFSRKLLHAVPSFMMSSESRPTFINRFRSVKDLVGMKVKNNDTWSTIPCNPKYLKEFKQNFEPIAIRGICDIVPKDYRDEEINCLTGFSHLIKTYITKEKKGVKYGQTVEIDLSNCPDACLALFFMAMNERSASVGLRSNYTTNCTDQHKGLDPIGNFSLLYKGVDEYYKYKDIESDYAAFIVPRESFPNIPTEQGFHGLAFSDCPFKDETGGIAFGEHGAQFHVRLRQYENFEGSIPDDTFTVVVLMLVIRDLRFKRNEKNGEFRFDAEVAKPSM